MACPRCRTTSMQPLGDAITHPKSDRRLTPSCFRKSQGMDLRTIALESRGVRGLLPPEATPRERPDYGGPRPAARAGGPAR